jgi:anti-sigma regulatory factor (Ser/Thr protein kinase)
MRAAAVAGLILLAAAPLPGCYRRVIRDQGTGRDGEEVYEPSLPDKPGPVEGLIWGETDPPSDRPRRR